MLIVLDKGGKDLFQAPFSCEMKMLPLESNLGNFASSNQWVREDHKTKVIF
jgi:hypothetical protein